MVEEQHYVLLGGQLPNQIQLKVAWLGLKKKEQLQPKHQGTAHQQVPLLKWPLGSSRTPLIHYKEENQGSSTIESEADGDRPTSILRQVECILAIYLRQMWCLGRMVLDRMARNNSLKSE